MILSYSKLLALLLVVQPLWDILCWVSSSVWQWLETWPLHFLEVSLNCIAFLDVVWAVSAHTAASAECELSSPVCFSLEVAPQESEIITSFSLCWSSTGYDKEKILQATGKHAVKTRAVYTRAPRKWCYF